MPCLDETLRRETSQQLGLRTGDQKFYAVFTYTGCYRLKRTIQNCRLHASPASKMTNPRHTSDHFRSLRLQVTVWAPCGQPKCRKPETLLWSSTEQHQQWALGPDFDFHWQGLWQNILKISGPEKNQAVLQRMVAIMESLAMKTEASDQSQGRKNRPPWRAKTPDVSLQTKKWLQPGLFTLLQVCACFKVVIPLKADQTAMLTSFQTAKSRQNVQFLETSSTPPGKSANRVPHPRCESKNIWNRHGTVLSKWRDRCCHKRCCCNLLRCASGYLQETQRENPEKLKRKSCNFTSFSYSDFQNLPEVPLKRMNRLERLLPPPTFFFESAWLQHRNWGRPVNFRRQSWATLKDEYLIPPMKIFFRGASYTCLNPMLLSMFIYLTWTRRQDIPMTFIDFSRSLAS